MNFVLRFRVKFGKNSCVTLLFFFDPRSFSFLSYNFSTRTISSRKSETFDFIRIDRNSVCRGIDPHPRILRGIILIKVSSFHCARPGTGKASFPGYFQPEISSIPRIPVGGTVFHNYPRYVIIIGGIDETQGGAASTIPRLKRGKVTRWNARATRGSIRNL